MRDGGRAHPLRRHRRASSREWAWLGAGLLVTLAALAGDRHRVDEALENLLSNAAAAPAAVPWAGPGRGPLCGPCRSLRPDEFIQSSV